MRLRLIFLAVGFAFCSMSLFSQNASIEFSITDSTAFLNNIKIDTPTKLLFFTEKFGRPDRIKKEKDIVTSIYDNLGISLISNRVTNTLYAIRFSFSNILKHYPKNNFSGKLFVNGIVLNSTDVPEVIQGKLTGFNYENTLGLYSFNNNKTDFYITIIPGASQWSSFNYNFFRRKYD